METKTGAVANEAPIILDLGKQRRKRIKQLTRGKGKLMDEVSRSIEELKNAGKISKSVQPLIVVVRQRPQSRFWMLPKI